MTAAYAGREPMRADAKFYLTMAIVSAVLIFAGFAPSFYLKSVIHAPPPLSLLTTIHGTVFTLWMALFITQAWLIAVDNVALHRQIGVMGALLFGTMLTLGYTTAITAARLGHAPPASPPPLAFMALPLFAITGTAILVGLALWFRRRSDWHKRLMIAALFTMTSPGTGRIAIPLGFAPEANWIALGTAELLLAIALFHDWRTERRIHPAYVVAVVVFAAIHVGVAWGFSSPTWLAFAHAIT
jgi:hypothetical protein